MPKRAKVNEYAAKAMALEGAVFELATGRMLREATPTELAWSLESENDNGLGAFRDPVSRRWVFVA